MPPNPLSAPGDRLRRAFHASVASVALVGLFVAAGWHARPAAAQILRPAATSVTDLYVSPTGSDKATGTSTAPLRTVQAALNRAAPGMTIHLAAGVYPSGGTTTVNGTATAPITIVGPSVGSDPTAGTSTAPTAVVQGKGHILAIANSYYVVEGFAIDGEGAVEKQVPVSQWPADGASAAAVQQFKQSVAAVTQNSRLIYVDGNGVPVVGTVIYRMVLTGSGGECVRVRGGASQTTISDSVVRWCGMYPSSSGTYTYHNGEGVYIGTSPKSTTLLGYADDETSGTLVQNSVIRTFGTECFDVKENAHANVLANSTCADNTEPTTDDGSNVELRGYGNTVSGNVIRYSAGYGVKISSDAPVYDRGGNSVTGNSLSEQLGAAAHVASTAAQGPTCGNTVSASDTGVPTGWTASCS